MAIACKIFNWQWPSLCRNLGASLNLSNSDVFKQGRRNEEFFRYSPRHEPSKRYGGQADPLISESMRHYTAAVTLIKKPGRGLSWC